MNKNLIEKEIIKIEQFCGDEIMFEAVKKVLLTGIYTHGTIQLGYTPDPLNNGALSLAALSTNNPISDEMLGQHIRGVWAGLNALENAIKELKKIKLERKEEVVSPYNDAV